MAHITEFSVSGLAGRNDIYAQKLNRRVNVFFGLNGSGKTSLLKILHSAMENDPVILRNVAFKSATVKIYSKSYDKIFTRTIEVKEETKSSGSVLVESEDLPLDSTSVYRDEIHLAEVSRAITENTWLTKPIPPNEFKGAWQNRYLPTSRLYPNLRRFT